MTIETIKKTDAGQELKIVDVSGANRSKGARKSVAVLLAAALLFGLAFTAVAADAHFSQKNSGEPPAEDLDDDVIPWDKPPVVDAGGADGGVLPTQLPT